MDERRQFSRILFAATAFIRQGEQEWNTKILDLSLNGALIEKPQEIQLSQDPVTLSFFLPDSEIELTMETRLVHDEKTKLGLKCLNIDVDSISHLRRMLELNIGDASLLNRELTLFIQAHDSSQ